MVASVKQRTGQAGHADRVVRQSGAGNNGRPPCCVKQCRKPPWYVTRTPGGVRGGHCEVPPYSIFAGANKDVVGAPSRTMTWGDQCSMGQSFRPLVLPVARP